MTRAAEWAGPVGEAWTDEWRRTDRTFAALEPELEAAILAVAPRPDGRRRRRFVDLGCGVGTTTLAVATARPDADVTGIDLSAGMIGVAAGRGAAVPSVRFVAGDALAAVGELAPIDLFFSRHGVMFYDDPPAAFGALAAAAAPGAGLVFSCFRAVGANAWASGVVAAMTDGVAGPSTVTPASTPPTGAPGPFVPDTFVPGPFAFADPDAVTAMLNAAGWTDIDHRPVDYAYVAGGGGFRGGSQDDDPVEEAVAFFRRIGPAASTLAAAAPGDRDAMVTRLRSFVTAHAQDGIVAFPAAAWIWTARRQERTP